MFFLPYADEKSKKNESGANQLAEEGTLRYNWDKTTRIHPHKDVASSTIPRAPCAVFRKHVAVEIIVFVATQQRLPKSVHACQVVLSSNDWFELILGFCLIQ